MSLDESLGASLLQALPLPGEIREAGTGKPSATPQTTETAAIPPPKTRKNGELVLRVESAALWSRRNATIPPNLLFLTGGNATVRGYGYRAIGARTENNLLYGGRYLGLASVEWQRPIVLRGNRTDFESAVFIDAGAVADKPGELSARVGLGAGLRWRSPVGPLQADLAYGVKTKDVRLHLRLGFSF